MPIPNDLEAEVIASRAKSVAYKYNATFITGDDCGRHQELRRAALAVPAGQIVDIGANGGPLTLDLMDQVIDLVKPGRARCVVDEQAQPPQALGAATGVGEPPGDRSHRLRTAGPLL